MDEERQAILDRLHVATELILAGFGFSGVTVVGCWQDEEGQLGMCTASMSVDGADRAKGYVVDVSEYALKKGEEEDQRGT